jgi:hypothetical protein
MTFTGNVGIRTSTQTAFISILHPPGVDELTLQESVEERWRPLLGVEQISVGTSMLSGSE